jgi:hypothetical protein
MQACSLEEEKNISSNAILASQRNTPIIAINQVSKRWALTGDARS